MRLREWVKYRFCHVLLGGREHEILHDEGLEGEKYILQRRKDDDISSYSLTSLWRFEPKAILGLAYDIGT